MLRFEALEGPPAIVTGRTSHDGQPTARGSLRQPTRKIQAAISGMRDTMTLARLIGGGAVADGGRDGHGPIPVEVAGAWR